MKLNWLSDITTDKPFFQASESQAEQHRMASQTPKTLLKYKQPALKVNCSTLSICMHLKLSATTSHCPPPKKKCPIMSGLLLMVNKASR